MQSSRDFNSYSPSIQEKLKILDSIIVETLSHPETDVHNLLSSILRTLRQFNLEEYYTEHDILVEGYLITIEKIKAGQDINNLPAWLKGVNFNIIRSLSKKTQKSELLKQRCLRYDTEIIGKEDDCTLNYGTALNIRILRDFLSHLPPLENKILNLWLVKGLSWKEIGDLLVDDGEEIKNDTALQQRLRQRGCRILKQLRKLYAAT